MTIKPFTIETFGVILNLIGFIWLFLIKLKPVEDTKEVIERMTRACTIFIPPLEPDAAAKKISSALSDFSLMIKKNDLRSIWPFLVVIIGYILQLLPHFVLL